MRKSFTLIALFLAIQLPLSAQIYLQIEKYGSAKTQKLSIGTYLEYRLYGIEDWQAGTIENLIPEEDIVVLNDRYVKLEDIQAFRFDTPQRWAKPLGRNIALFGASWALFSVGSAIFDKDDQYTWGDATVTGTAVVTGLLIRRIFRFKKYHFDKKNQLRILDFRMD